MCKAIEEYGNRIAIKAEIEAGIAYGIDKEQIKTRLIEKSDVSSEEAE